MHIARFNLFRAALSLLISILSLSVDAQPRFNQLLAFAGTNSVRISAEFDPGSASDTLDFSGKVSRVSDGKLLWQGTLGRYEITGAKAVSVSNTIANLAPELWSPVSPTLYHFEITARAAGRILATRQVRFGFRSFEICNGQFHLNGQPIFLRGIAINPPGRGIPSEVGESRKFAEDYVRFLKSQNVNIFRISTDESQVWFDVCDELGMMLYAGRYGAPVASVLEKNPEARGNEPEEGGKRAPPEDFEKSIAGYKELFSGYASHPSIVEYYLSNELPRSGARGAAFSDYLTRAIAELKKWDDTRPYIGNAGYGEGREGDVCDVHRYWGWYYNSFLTYFNLRDKLFEKPLFGDAEKNQPLTFTECVGSFTGSSGEINVVRSKQLAPRLGWIGHTETPREDALAYQSFMTKQACESFRRMRPLNPRLAGLMPFTILFYNWSGISNFADMKPKPVMDAMRIAYQPVLLSWENWKSQIYAGDHLKVTAHIINDDDRKRDLRNATLHFVLQSRGGNEAVSGQLALPPISYYGTWSKKISLEIPANFPTGDYLLIGHIVANGETVSTNYTDLFIAGKDWKDFQSAKDIICFDREGATKTASRKIGLALQQISGLSSIPKSTRTIVLGGGALSASDKNALRQFVRDGGRVLWLQPDAANSDWLPQKISFFTSSPNDTDYPPKSRPFREQMNVNLERPEHQVFAGLNRRRFSLWSDYTDWDQTKPGFPKIYPVTRGFKLDDPTALARTAILADYDRGLEGIALCEMFDGKGSVIVSGFDLANRAGLDPVADRLFANLVAYAASESPHEVHPPITEPIRWGDFPSERGVVCGLLNGLLVNCEWIPSPANPHAKPLAPNTGAWNMLPGEQFVPRGRNPFGAYGYSTASSLRDGNPDSKIGEGFFWARLPAGKKFVVTTVKNPEKESATLRVTVNDQSGATTETIAPGETKRIRTAFSSHSPDVCVRYAGEKTLVLLETEFE